MVEAHRPTRAQLEDTVSPQPVVKDGKLDVQPNEKYDAPDGSEELATLPKRQRDLIAILILGAERAQITPEVSLALKTYEAELLSNGTHPALGTLTDMHAIIWGEYNTLKREKFFNGKGALKNSFDAFNANHRLFITHFPLDAKREAMLRDRPVDRTALNIDETRSLADQFKNAAEAIGEQGLATPDFVTVSRRIADDLKTATYVAPAAPIDRMNANRDIMAWSETPYADRAVIKALTFSDSVRSKLKQDNFTEAGWKLLHDSSLVATLTALGMQLAKAIF